MVRFWASLGEVAFGFVPPGLAWTSVEGGGAGRKFIAGLDFSGSSVGGSIDTLYAVSFADGKGLKPT